jgi:mannose-6-phosphate isomerase
VDPLVFEPFYRPQIWGGRRLETQLGKPLPSGQSIGEAWEISAHPMHVSRVAEGPLAGLPLTDLWAKHGRELTGTTLTGEFPLLIKYLDCQELLSIQVHPNDQIANEIQPGSLGKTEAWAVIHAEPQGQIYSGLRPGVTPQDVERGLADGTLADCLHAVTPRAGDVVFLAAGTVHAVGGGVLIAEVQQSSDLTFRLFDWNRVGPDGKPRQLHRREALMSIDWSRGPVDPVTPQTLGGLPAGVRGEKLAACEYFAMERFEVGGPFTLPYARQLSIWMILAGAVRLADDAGGYARTFRQGETVMIPATAPSLAWTPVDGPAKVLGVTVGK